MIIDYLSSKDKRWGKYKNREIDHQDHKYKALYRYVNLLFNPRPPSAKKQNVVS